MPCGTLALGDSCPSSLCNSAHLENPVREAQGATDERAWAAFSRKFRREMSAPDRSRELDVLAALSHHTNLSLGCYCRDESRCHRSLLRELLAERNADVV